MLAGIERQIAGAPRPTPRRYAIARLAVWIRRRQAAASAGAVLPAGASGLRCDCRPGGARLDPKVAWQLEGLGWEVLTGWPDRDALPFNPPGRGTSKSAGLAVGGRAPPRSPKTPSGPRRDLAKGPNVFSGLGQSEATAEAFTDDGCFTPATWAASMTAICTSSGAAG
jgi:hypothetical protein